MTMTSYGSEGLAYPLREAWVTGRQGIMRRFVGPVCGALRMEREARGRKVFIILADQKRVQSEEGSEITERDSGAGGGAQLSPASFPGQRWQGRSSIAIN